MRSILQFVGVIAVLSLLASPAMAWETVTSEEGGFSVDLPTEPFEVANTMPTTNGETEVVFYIAQSEATPGVAFFVGFASYPGGEEIDAEAELNAAVDHFLETGGGNLQSSQEIEVEGGIGREITATSDEGIMAHLRTFIIEDTIYFLAVSAPGGDLPLEEVKTFHNSFVLEASEVAP